MSKILYSLLIGIILSSSTVSAMQPDETIEHEATSVCTFAKPLSFSDLPLEYQLHLTPMGDAPLMKGSFFESDSEPYKKQAQWNPEILKKNKMLIIRGQKFLDSSYMKKIFNEHLESYYQDISHITPSIEQLTFSLTFYQPIQSAQLICLNNLEKTSFWSPYGLVLEVPEQNIFSTSNVDTQSPTSQSYLKQAKQANKEVKDVLWKWFRYEPKQLIEASSSSMNNEVNFVPEVVINEVNYKVKISGFYVRDEITWDKFKFYPSQFCTPENLAKEEEDQKREYEKKFCTQQEVQEIEFIAQKLGLPIYYTSKPGFYTFR